MGTSEQMAQIDAWRGQVADMASEIRARYPRWVLAKNIFNQLNLLNTELIRLRQAVILNDPVVIEGRRMEQARVMARANLAESEELARKLAERLARVV